MDMDIWSGTLAVVLIWLVAPFVEMGIIVFLAISNDRYKKRIKELTAQKDRAGKTGQTRTGQAQAGQGVPSAVRQSGYGTRPVSVQQDIEQLGDRPKDRDVTSVSSSLQPPMEGAAEMVQVKAGPSGGSLSERFKASIQSNLGTLALVIGVIFVAIAGMIFATTTWNTLPAAAKAFLVLGGAGLFFGASYLAE